MAVWLLFAVIMTLGNITADNESGAISRLTFLLFMYIMFGIMFLILAITINQSAKAISKSNDSNGFSNHTIFSFIRKPSFIKI